MEDRLSRQLLYPVGLVVTVVGYFGFGGLDDSETGRAIVALGGLLVLGSFLGDLDARARVRWRRRRARSST